jgi:SNF2 family DNA or RNA helicase
MGKPTLKRKSQSTLSSPPNKSALSQLQSLRELLGSTTFSEKDIYKCLQQSGYNVNIAAERLLCGFFKQSSNDSPILFNGSKSTSASPSFMGESSGRDNEHSSSKRPKPSSSCYSSTTSKTQSIKPNKSEFEVTNNDVTTKMQGENIKFDTLPNILFLCQKWIVGFSTSRFGSIKYQENIHIHTSSSDSTKNDGSNIVRFKGSRIEGTLDSNLSNMLSLLLRHEYICVECHGLLEDNQLHIGSEVPLQVNVYLRKPIDFFQLWDIASNNNVTDGDTSNIDNNILKKTITGKTKVLPKNNNSKSSKNNKTDIAEGLSNAAFDLLQWSQYDQLPTFRKPPNSDTGNTSKSLVTSPSTSNENNFSPSESKNNSIINADKASIIDDDDSKYEDVDNIDVYDESNSPEWAKSILDSNQTLPEEADPVMFTETGISLRSYQRQALYWMLQRERDEDGTSDGLKKQTELLSELLSTPSSTTNSSRVSLNDDESVVIDQRGQSPGPVKVTRTEALQSTTIQGKSNQIVHPLWQTRYLWDKSKNLLHSFYVNELMQTATCVPPNPPKQCVGGLLCDAMGLGKTVMLLSLIAKSKEIFDYELKDGLKLTNSTLVVTPLCLLSQWEEEIASKTTLTCSVYYGESSKKSVETHHKTDVVLTTYGMLLSHFKVNNTQTNFIFSHVWDRIILDEAHLIKNPQTIVSRACCSLQSKRRWCVTGTPIQNSIQDVYGLLKFLRHEPWCEASFWKNVVTNTMVNKSQPSYDGVQQVENAVDDSMNIAFDRVRRVLTPLMLRRTKDSVSSDG